MKLGELLIVVNQLANRVGKALKNADLCKECPEGTSPEEHMKRHINEAADIKNKLPHNIVWNLEKIRMTPKITFTLDKKGHLTANLDEVDLC